MSRSRKKHWYGSNTCAQSEKYDKQMANRKFRHKSKNALKNGTEPPYSKNEISDIWNWAKDGKSSFKDLKYARK